MNIWYINPYAGGPGVGRYWRSFYLASAWKAKGHSVEVIAPSYHHLMDDSTGRLGCQVLEGVSYNFVRCPRYKGNGLARFFSMVCFGFLLLFSLLRLGLKKRPDIIVYSSAHPFGYPAAFFCAKLFRCKISFEVRDIWPLSLIEVAGFSKLHPVVIWLSLIEKFAYFSADSVISLLPGAKQHMVSRGMNPTKFRYVPNGFSFDDVYSANESNSSKLLDDLARLKSQGEFIFFYAGALGEPNAMHLFLDALCFLNVTGETPVKFIIVGKGEQGPALSERCRQLGYDFVVFYPQVDKREIRQALHLVNAGFFVMHDLPIYRFGVSLNKLYDYMAAGIPVVASYNACNDPVEQSGCGFSVVPGQAEHLANAFKKMMLLDESVLIEMGAKGRLFLEKNFEYAGLAQRILED
ncbi:glycosyltransferase family 4 protein [Pseudomonas sp. R1-6]|uniref:glycosyltransferase family 4 protein n=1 Tax=Pseudomonas sp. R1-6 TaxID=2817397 RepID=UPI003DA864CA